MRYASLPMRSVFHFDLLTSLWWCFRRSWLDLSTKPLFPSSTWTGTVKKVRPLALRILFGCRAAGLAIWRGSVLQFCSACLGSHLSVMTSKFTAVPRLAFKLAYLNLASDTATDTQWRLAWWDDRFGERGLSCSQRGRCSNLFFSDIFLK